ncbi:MAG TPA: ABC transporter ATP-binding protein [Chitinivibrionales bacterium]|nr:ABC transporter ATP-binding protein [Chitinivibrionales bacterium]
MNHFKQYLRMLGYLKPYIPMLVLTVVLSLLVVTFESLSLWFFGPLIKSIFKPESFTMARPAFSINNANEVLKYWTYLLVKRDNVFDTLKIVCLWLILFFLAKNIFSYVKGLVTGNLNFFITRDMRNHLYSHALVLPVTYYDRNRSGNIISLMFNDIAAINNSMTGTFEKIVTDPLRLIFFITVLIIISPKLTLFVFGIYPILGVLVVQIGRTVRRRSRRSLEIISGLSSIMNETVSCIRVVKMFNMNEAEEAKFRAENKRFTRTCFRAQVFNALSSPLTETLGIFMVAALLWLGGRDVLMGKGFTGEDFVRFLAFLFIMFQPLKSLSQVNNSIQAGLAAADRVFTILDTAPEKLPSVAASVTPVFDHEIRLDDVRFTYPGCEEEVIHDMSFTVAKGQVVALVGSSGSGKTTILDLLPRFYDISGGSITIDGIDTREFDLVGLRSLFGIVSQETVLFNDTVQNNISYGITGAPLQAIIEAARVAQAWEFIEKMPHGLSTVIGERGVMLSGGQRQRLAIARALLKNPQILILDEATSALDTESERLVQSAIDNLMKDRTALVVAHRLSTIARADRILVLEDGRLTEQGTHEELMKLNKRYKYLHQIQFMQASA